MQTDAQRQLGNNIVAALAASLAAQMGGGKERLFAALREQLPLTTALSEILTQPQLVGRADGYAREALHVDPDGLFSIMLLTWRQGQHSPVHAHWTWCGYVVLRGELTEALYRWEGGAPRCTAQRRHRVGDAIVTDAGHTEIHRLGNLASQTAVSLHVYGVDGARIKTHVNRVFEAA